MLPVATESMEQLSRICANTVDIYVVVWDEKFSREVHPNIIIVALIVWEFGYTNF